MIMPNTGTLYNYQYYRMHCDLKKCHGLAHSVGGIHYRNTEAEEQPLTWNSPQGALPEISPCICLLYSPLIDLCSLNLVHTVWTC